MPHPITPDTRPHKPCCSRPHLAHRIHHASLTHRVHHVLPLLIHMLLLLVLHVSAHPSASHHPMHALTTHHHMLLLHVLWWLLHHATHHVLLLLLRGRRLVLLLLLLLWRWQCQHVIAPEAQHRRQMNGEAAATHTHTSAE